MSAEDVRNKVRASIPAEADLGLFFFDRVTELKALGLSSTVPSQTDLLGVLAADMARDKGGDAAKYMADATLQIEGNNTTALTSSNDRYTGIKGGESFDELHELIHICSAPGGASELHQWKLQVNEGAINVFSELAAPKAGVNVVTRYETETRVVKKLLKIIEGDKKKPDGFKALYGMTFLGAKSAGPRKTFFDLVGAAYRNLGDKKPDGTNKGFREKNATADEMATEFADKAKNWNVKWLEERLPAV